MDVDKKFPAGMRVLAIDDDCICLKITEMLLRTCKYDVTAVSQAEVALELLRARKGAVDQFDIVITEVHMPGMDDFELLDLVSLEMNIPVIMLSANDELESMMKGIKKGACDYLVKPACMEKVKNLWKHVVKKGIKGGNGDDGHKLQPGDADGKKECAKMKRKYTMKDKEDGHDTEVENSNTSTQKRPRIKWSGELDRRFVEVINYIGIDRAVPKTVLKMMNVQGLERTNVASHLQKYRINMQKAGPGPFKLSNPSANKHGWNEWNRGSLNTATYKAAPAFPRSPNSSSNPFAWTESTSAFGTRSSLLPTQSVQFGSAQRNLVISGNDMRPVGQGGSLLKDAAAPGPQQDASQFITFGGSHINMPGGSKILHFGPSGSSIANSSDGIGFINTSKSSPSGSSGILFANTLQVRSTGLPSYASMFRQKLLGASRNIPVDDDDEFQSIAGGDVLTSQSPLPSSADLVGKIVTEPPRFARQSISTNNGETAMPPNFDDLGHMDGTFEGPSQGNDLTVDQLLERPASSCQMPDSENELQNQMGTVMGEKATTMVGFNYQMAHVNLRSNRKSIVMPTDNCALGSASNIISTLPNGEGVSGNLPANDSTDTFQAVVDQLLNDNSEPLDAAGEVREIIGYLLGDGW